MSDFTRAGDIRAPINTHVKIGDVYVERTKLREPFPEGRAWVVDVFPFEGPPRRVCVELSDGGKREWLSIEDFHARFLLRKATK